MSVAVKHTDSISTEGKDPSANECPRYDTKQSDDTIPIRLELWEMQSTISFSSFPGSLWLGVLTHKRVPSMGQIELLVIYTEYKQMTYAKLNCLKWNYLII